MVSHAVTQFPANARCITRVIGASRYGTKRILLVWATPPPAAADDGIVLFLILVRNASITLWMVTRLRLIDGACASRLRHDSNLTYKYDTTMRHEKNM